MKKHKTRKTKVIAFFALVFQNYSRLNLMLKDNCGILKIEQKVFIVVFPVLPFFLVKLSFVFYYCRGTQRNCGAKCQLPRKHLGLKCWTLLLNSFNLLAQNGKHRFILLSMDKDHPVPHHGLFPLRTCWLSDCRRIPWQYCEVYAFWWYTDHDVNKTQS